MINFTNNQDSKYPEKLIKGLRMEMGHKNERVWPTDSLAGRPLAIFKEAFQ